MSQNFEGMLIKIVNCQCMWKQLNMHNQTSGKQLIKQILTQGSGPLFDENTEMIEALKSDSDTTVQFKRRKYVLNI